ncbi:MAG: DUF4124 domain-containing protein [Gammaproteobacteria bacterium]|nr:DUF4124 domain-containing protein [Gammaproteobacteria bacterium]
MSTHRFVPFLAFVAAISAAQAAPGFYKWVNENGEVVYSQFPPADRQHQPEIIKPPPPPAESPARARERLNQQLQQYEDNREDRELAAEKAAEDAEKATVSRQRCEAAKHNLQGINGRSRQLFRAPDGQVRRLTDEERQSQRAELEAIIAKDCK